MGVTLISETTYQEKLSHYKLTNNTIPIKTYANESLNVLGNVRVTFSGTVQYNKNMLTNFPLNVIAGDSANLLGSNCLLEVKLDWAILFNPCKENLNNVSKTDDIREKLENKKFMKARGTTICNGRSRN